MGYGFDPAWEGAVAHVRRPCLVTMYKSIAPPRHRREVITSGGEHPSSL